MNEEFIITVEERKKLEAEIKERDKNERQIFNAGMKFGEKIALESIRKFIIKMRKKFRGD